MLRRQHNISKNVLLKKLETTVPRELKNPITNLLLSTFQSASPSDFKITPFEKKGVFSKTILLIEYHSDKYILKETEKFNSREKICEIIAMKLASDAHATPLLKAVDVKHSIVLLKYIQHDFSELEIIKSQTVNSIADTLKSIHGLDVSKYQNLFPYKNKFLPFLLNQIQALTLDYPHLYFYRKIIHTINFIEEILTPYKLKLCHYDLHPWNLLYDKPAQKVFAIDWESVGIGDELYDIATVAAYLRLNSEQENMLLKRYYDNDLSDKMRWRFLLNKIQASLFYSLGFIFVCRNHQPYLNFSEEQKLVPFQYFEEPISKLFLLDLTPIENYRMSYRLIKSAFILLHSQEYENAMRYIISENLNCYSRYNRIWQISLLTSKDREILDQLHGNVDHAKTNENVRLLFFYALASLFISGYQKNLPHILLVCRFAQSILKTEYNMQMDIITGKKLFKIKIKKHFLLFKESHQTFYDKQLINKKNENQTKLKF